MVQINQRVLVAANVKGLGAVAVFCGSSALNCCTK